MSINYDAYQIFADKVVYKSRFVLDDESKKFKAFLKNSATKRAATVSCEHHLYRARKGYACTDGGFFKAYPTKDMLAPPPDKAREGRINPKGIPCFYAADHFKTAISEMRPWVGELISVAIFQPSRSLTVIDLTNDEEASTVFKKCLRKALPKTEQEIESQIWSELNRAFSEPVPHEDQSAKYTPTQIICEWFKSWRFDGVAYKSSIHTEGKNFAFFNANDFTINNEAGQSQVHRIAGIEVNSDPADSILTVSNNTLK